MTAEGDGAHTPSAEDTSDGVITTLEVIESQPLEHRAAGYEALHDELMQRLDASVPGMSADTAGAPRRPRP